LFTVSERLYLLFLVFCLTYMRREICPAKRSMRSGDVSFG